jgi:hypothetical protein
VTAAHPTGETMNRLVLLTAVVALLSVSFVSRAAAPIRVEKPPIDDLGDGLLEGLDGAAFAPPKTPPRDQPERKPVVDLGEVERRMNEQAGGPAGEDVGESPLLSVARTMQLAEGKIPEEATATPDQRKAVKQLDEVIAAMEKQCNGGGQCNKPSSKKEQQKSQRSGAKSGKGSKPAGMSASESQASTSKGSSSPQLTQRKPEKPSGQAPADLVKEAWGHLPARMRERMLQGTADEFLPEYREELEAYYKRLAEREAQRAAE